MAAAGGRSISPEQEARVLEMYRDPNTRVNDIAAEVGLGRSSVYWVLEKNGITPTRTRRAGMPAPEGGLTRDEHEELGALRAQMQMLGRLADAVNEGRLNVEGGIETALLVMGEYMTTEVRRDEDGRIVFSRRLTQQ